MKFQSQLDRARPAALVKKCPKAEWYRIVQGYPLEIDQKANPSTGAAQGIETLRDMLLSEALHSLQFDHEHIFDQNIGILFSNVLTLIADGKRRLGSSTDAAQPEFPPPGTLAQFFKESGAQGVADFEDGAYDAVRKSVFFICVHLCLSVALIRLVPEEIEDSQKKHK